MMNSAVQDNARNILDGPPMGASPLTTYSGQDRGLIWRTQEAQMPGTQVGDKGIQLPHPQFGT
jgi:hypothetical protein